MGPLDSSLERLNSIARESWVGSSLTNGSDTVIPFLKWAGGKRWLFEHLRDHIPVKFDRYVEPFLGGGAIFFALKPQKAVLSDINDDLISTYKAIRGNYQLVQRYLRKFAVTHCNELYYSERNFHSRSIYKNAARFIYINRVCWNGLYRVNLRGEFNVPLGTKTRVQLGSDNFSEIADLLRRATMKSQDFERTLNTTNKDDFVFVDPPYVTAHNFNGFIKYNEKLFGWEDQIRLRDAIGRAKRRGVRVLLSNADHDSIHALYDGVGQVHRIPRSSIIAASAQRRGQTTELIIAV